MPKWALVMCVWLVLAIGTVTLYAQDATSLAPISTLEAGDFRALALTADGDRLLVADAENQQVRVYNFNDPAQPTLLTSLDVSGAPVLLAGGSSFGLVAEMTDSAGADTLEVIAPAFPSPRAEFIAGRNFIDIGKDPHTLTMSPDERWGVVIGTDTYTVLRINAPDDIESITVSGSMEGAVLSNTTAYVLHGDLLAASPLERLQALQPVRTLPLNGTPSAVALNEDETQGVVVIDGTRLLLFDPAAMEQTGEFTLAGAPITSIHYLRREGGDFFLITREGATDVTIIDPANPDSASFAATESLDNPITALATFGQIMVVTDGVTIRIFSA